MSAWIARACGAVCALLFCAPTWAQKVPEVALERGTTSGAWPAERPQLACSGLAVYAVWADHRDFERQVRFNRSLDRGATWLASDVRLDGSSPPSGMDSSEPRIAAAGDSVYVVWSQDNRILFDRSLDRGTTWLASDVALDVGAPNAASLEAEIACEGAAVYVVWTDFRDSPSSLPLGDVYFNRSLDGGTTWLAADVRLDTDAPGSAASGTPRIEADGAAVFVVWSDARDGFDDVRFNRSLDSGATWLASDVRLDLGSAPGSATSYRPDLAVGGAAIHVVWYDERNGAADVYYNRSLDAGATWLVTDARIDLGDTAGASLSELPVVALSGASVLVAWSDGRHGGYDVFLNRSLDEGATWSASEQRLNVGAALGASSYPNQIALATEADTVFAVWTDDRDGLADLRVNRSLDAGATWLAVDPRVNLGVAPGLASAHSPVLALSGANAYVAWLDHRNGSSDVFFDLLRGAQPYGIGRAGTGGVVPRLRARGSPSIGGSLVIDLERGRGAASGVLLVGFGGARELVRGASPTFPRAPWTRVPLLLDGAPGAAGAGGWTTSIAVPNDLGLLGRRLDLQALVLDPAAFSGKALSAPLEIWLL